MAGINKVILIGNLGADPEIRYMPNGDPVANLSLATSERWTDKQTGEQRESVEWHRVIAFRQLADVIGKYCKRGSKLYIEGKLKTRKWTDNNGIERYTTEIIADQMQMLDSKDDDNRGQNDYGRNSRTQNEYGSNRPPARQLDDFDDSDSIPF